MFPIIYYLPIGFLIIGVLCAIIIPIAKKEQKKLEELILQLPKEKLDKLKEFKFERDELLGRNIFVGTGLVADIITNENRVEVIIMFFNEPRAEIYSQITKLTIDEYNKKNIKKLEYVKCAMKYDKDMYIYHLKNII